jgi:hypothetical protein
MSQISLPNSIPRSKKVDYSMSSPGREWLYLFCASCGADGGRVLATDVPNREEFAFYLCNDCAGKHGAIDGTYTVPDEVFFQKVREASIERRGRELQPHEILVELDDPHSFLTKLVKDRKAFLASE